MKLSATLVKEISLDLSNKITNNRIATITVVNSHDLLFAFSVYRKEKLLISLNHQMPFVSFTCVDESIPTITGHINDTLRKELKDAYITGVETLNNDRILVIDLLKSNDFYEKEKRTLIIELIPHRPNLFLLDEKSIIIYAFHTSSLDTSRPIIKGLSYQALPTYNFENQESSSLQEIKDYASSYLINSKKERLKEKYQLVFKHIKSKIKSLEKKLIVLANEEKRAKDNYIYKEYGDMIFAYSDDMDSLKDYLKENKIDEEYDFSLSFGVNADHFYKKYKKAKRTLEMNQIEKNKASDSLSYYESLQGQISYMNDEELLLLAESLFPHKFKQKNKNKNHSVSYVEVNNHRIYFGKNSEQNEMITFKMAQKDYWYFHIKDYHGAHVVIFNDNPTNEEKLIASEMCLILSNKTAGEIMYSQIKDVKKSNTKGMALLDKYQLIVLKDIRKETINLLDHYHH